MSSHSMNSRSGKQQQAAQIFALRKLSAEFRTGFLLLLLLAAAGILLRRRQNRQHT